MAPSLNTARKRLSSAAYWVMLQRVVFWAGSINVVWVLMFAAMAAPLMVSISLVSVAMYAVAYVLLGRRRNRPAVVLVWLEVLIHSVAGSLALGWDSGYHYFLMLFIPALVLGTPRRKAQLGTATVILLYAGLYALCQTVGPMSALTPLQSYITMWINIALVFAMFYSVADFYRRQVLAAERRLMEMATIDPLTGLANRAQFHLRAHAALNPGHAAAKAAARPMALVLADVDYFKRINDEYGHDAGDKVLVRLAELMKSELAESDVLARWGGEEFLALLPLRDGVSAADVAERVRQAVASVQIDVDGRLLNVTMSFGVAQVDALQDLQQATRRADEALYASKRAGRNRVTRVAGAELLPVG